LHHDVAALDRPTCRGGVDEIDVARPPAAKTAASTSTFLDPAPVRLRTRRPESGRSSLSTHAPVTTSTPRTRRRQAFIRLALDRFEVAAALPVGDPLADAGADPRRAVRKILMITWDSWRTVRESPAS
jgi:hypothetical protein